MNEDKILSKGVLRIQQHSEEELAQMREDAEWERNLDLIYQKNQQTQKCRERIAKRLLLRGDSVEQVADITDLEINIVNKIKAEAKFTFTIRHYSEEELAQARERMREDAELEEASALNYARKKGEYNNAVKIAKAMLADGMPIDKITKATELDVNVVSALA